MVLTHVSEAMVIVVHYINQHWEIQQRVIRLMLLAKSLTGVEVARQLITCLSTELGISSDLLVTAMRDRAAVNNVAISELHVLLPSVT